jgi:hypothetical protein
LAQLHPDRFARAIVWAGPVVPSAIWPYPAAPSGPSCPADQPDCAYSLIDLFGNTRNLPLLVVQGGTDDLVPASGVEYWMGEYAAHSAATFRYRFYPGRTHETSFPGTMGEAVQTWLAGLPPRVRMPARVTYAVGRVDASRATRVDSVDVVPTEMGADALGPFRLTGQDVTPAPTAGHRVRLRLTGLSRVVLRVPGVRRVTGTTDRPVTLRVARREFRIAAGRFSFRSRRRATPSIVASP